MIPCFNIAITYYDDEGCDDVGWCDDVVDVTLLVVGVKGIIIIFFFFFLIIVIISFVILKQKNETWKWWSDHREFKHCDSICLLCRLLLQFTLPAFLLLTHLPPLRFLLLPFGRRQPAWAGSCLRQAVGPAGTAASQVGKSSAFWNRLSWMALPKHARHYRWPNLRAVFFQWEIQEGWRESCWALGLFTREATQGFPRTFQASRAWYARHCDCQCGCMETHLQSDLRSTVHGRFKNFIC